MAANRPATSFTPVDPHHEVRRLPMDAIVVEPGFSNSRSSAEKKVDKHRIELLAKSMEHIGLLNPISVKSAVIAKTDDLVFLLRAGFRRLKAAQLLGWTEVNATIINPADDPNQDFWTNAEENLVRDDLSPFEVARLAQRAVEFLDIKPETVARRFSKSSQTIHRYLNWLRVLPQDILDDWKDRHPYLDPHMLDKLAAFVNPLEASAVWSLEKGETPKRSEFSQVGRKKYYRSPVCRPSLPRLIRLRTAIEMSELDPKVKEMALMVAEFAQGIRKVIPGVFPPKKKVVTEEEPEVESPPKETPTHAR